MRIHIVGAGWLGWPLAIHLQKNNHKIAITTRSNQHPNTAPHISHFTAHFTENEAKIDPSFFDCNILIITLPYKRSFEPSSIYQKQIQHLLKKIPSKVTPNIIFTSSTSVYPNDNQTWTENKPISSFTERSKTLYKIEETLLKSRFPTAIVRLAGLFGPNRFPGRFFSGQHKIQGGRNPINLVHLDDCIGAIIQIIQKNTYQKIWNICCPKHPIKQEFYTAAAKKGPYEIGSFLHTLTPHKIIDSSAIQTELNFTFKYPSPYHYLNQLEN